MRLDTIILTLLPALAAADFHIDNLSNTAISSGTGQTRWSSTVACPSNYWNCKCLTQSDRTGRVEGSLGNDVFAVRNLCGMKKLNFYKSGSSYQMYEDSGNGKVIGNCYRNDGDVGKQCGITGGNSIVTQGYVCYSYVCN
ncbi:uncharacterized protein FTOL_09750 [Fusarium torulosum]|uniref:Cyanovirin-N domain-containing protein n=1 Tax=Fusarium torulosum TaxID=33205 RepID=A0AAE8MGB7_9HYPO|nr:uncharacterized protein FTOL_09750 [Fusarium torulosum]